MSLEKGQVINQRWTIVGKIASGGFGSVYVSTDSIKGDQCAIKAEAANVSKPVLRRLSETTQHACELLGSGRIPERCTFIAMTLLGQDLYKLQRTMPARRFEGWTVARLAIQCVDAIKALHEIGYVHRDIKPSNYVMGLPPHKNRVVHLIDFGLARPYWKPGGKEVEPPRSNVGFHGTLRYASITAHLGQELARRDDLWSLMYVLVEFRSGSLPWRNEVDNRKVARMKRQWGSDVLANVMEPQYMRMAEQVLQLKYADTPEYDEYLNLIREAQQSSQFRDDGPFEWE